MRSSPPTSPLFLATPLLVLQFNIRPQHNLHTRQVGTPHRVPRTSYGIRYVDTHYFLSLFNIFLPRRNRLTFCLSRAMTRVPLTATAVWASALATLAPRRPVDVNDDLKKVKTQLDWRIMNVIIRVHVVAAPNRAHS